MLPVRRKAGTRFGPDVPCLNARGHLGINRKRREKSAAQRMALPRPRWRQRLRGVILLPAIARTAILG